MTAIGHNSLAMLEATYAQLRHHCNNLAQSAECLTACDEENVGDAILLYKMLQIQAKSLDEARTTEKKPYIDSGKAVDDFFKPLAEMIERYQAKVGLRLYAYLDGLDVPDEPKVRNSYGQCAFFVTTTDWEVVDEAKIPREYLSPDKKKINAALDRGDPVPGLALKVKKGLRVR